ncbi:MAG: CDP-alcohol phosphatidyltransferase [Herbinix sp.]|jgi:CDP-diacylglycerol--glycerol-3-phosphate 3-phosphatidyltransferase|nr:CDP-alcohol phosphatidyltransferase [Herbinix sp.]
MKLIPNVITMCRIILSITLLMVRSNITVFAIIYLLCGFSDALDGYLARKLKAQSKLGAKLDSAADIMMFGMIMVCMILILGKDLLRFYPYILIIATIRMISVVIAAIKYHTFLSIHTWGNKLSGLCIFLAPLLLLWKKHIFLLYPLLAIALLSAVEEMIIHLSSDQPDPDRKSIFMK